MAEGLCKLTGQAGRFVKSHIIPQALTRASSNVPLVQAGEGRPPVKRWSSWYDAALVTRPGENILADHDSWGVRELRRLRLIWSSWNGRPALDAPIVPEHEDRPYRGYRVIDTDAPRLRRFLLSLLWRAAETRLPDFAHIVLEEAEREALRQAVLQVTPAPPGLFPITLIQLSTMGLRHNMAPIRDVKLVPRPAPLPPEELPILRFFLDGLIVYFHLNAPEGFASRLGSLILGTTERTSVITIPFEESLQLTNMVAVAHESELRFPREIDRLFGKWGHHENNP